jgi:lipoprotein-anchoring transpeptidase ErfK/SrfK
MLRSEDPIRKLAAAASVMLIAAAEALAQDNLARTGRRVVVSIPDRKLAVIEAGRVVKVFPTAVGAPRTPSPRGEFTVIQRVVAPAWYTKGRIVPPGKGNPLGTRWLGLSVKGYGIHGTNVPASIGRNASHGCIRMRNRDVEELFEMVAVGDAVELHGERNAETERLFGAPASAAQVVASAAMPAATAEPAGEGQ